MKIQPNLNITPHFKLREFDCRGSGEIVPAKYHANLTRLCNLLEDIRTLFGDKPLTITSGYRSAAHNDLIYKKARQKKPNAGKLSQHLLCTAADFHIQGMDIGGMQAILERLYAGDPPSKITSVWPDRLEAAKRIQKQLRGLGLGAHQGFIHVDVREGRKATWSY